MRFIGMDERLEKEWERLQTEMSNKISLKNSFKKEDIKYVAGVDLAYYTLNQKEFAVCNILIFNYETLELEDQAEYHGEVKVPYVAGFLAFRELPFILEAVKKLIICPDIYMFDGNGYLHYRHMGLATHASFYLNKPTIGVAKNYLKIAETDFIMPNETVNSHTDIVVNGELYGRCLRTRAKVKPIFISCGNWIDIETTTEVVLHFITSESRLPIPVRYADIETHKSRTGLLEDDSDRAL
ncbi:endonuclease V [Listeria booriae]|uniref:Endonuclease V n=2 Tax=Listeria booriae TaxID=1552123 RepID=A0A7X0ZW95_9LIST|nr:endonuclease V [Listeria booriae]MBC2292210.1 endonuclease V [Listeria booriae]MBC2305626.1 endonuclease V [Listeria booriae]MBC2311658.1 endonuclease V [Listeria booriae]